MKISSLKPEDLVLAFDRTAQCLRVVPAIETEIVDSYKQVIKDYIEVDTDRGLLTRKLPSGQVVSSRGNFFVVVKDEVAKRLGTNKRG